MKIINKVHIFNENRRVDENGYLFVPNCPLIHEGIMEYLGSELMQDDIKNIDGVELVKDKVYKLNVSKKELKNSLKTFELIPIVNDHVFLGNDGENAKGKQEGAVGQDLRMEDMIDEDGVKKSFILGTVNFTNLETINKIQQGSKEELSTAYSNNLVKSNNSDYDFEVVDIKGNHIALVEKGRAGSKVRVVNSIINNKSNSIMINLYTLNGKDISEEDLKKALGKKEEKKAENEYDKDMDKKKKETKEENKSKNEDDKEVEKKKDSKKSENEDEDEKKEKEIKNKKKTKNSVSVELMNSIVAKAKDEVKKDFANRIKAYNSVKGKVGEFDYSQMEEKEIYSHALKNCDIELQGNEGLEALKLSFKVLNAKTRIENISIDDNSESVIPNHIN